MLILTVIKQFYRISRNNKAGMSFQKFLFAIFTVLANRHTFYGISFENKNDSFHQ